MKKVQNLMPLSFVILGALLTWYLISITAPATSGQMMTGPSMMNKNMRWTTESGMTPVMRGEYYRVYQLHVNYFKSNRLGSKC